ncbi:MAG: DNA-binding response regulator [Candidatus Methylumidiphilus alinenensis]|uniref:DNA-binding response regulator n=1 Tax=Candidatus Methylumidiphilus alinenensis TaxID=2202197 RepID=A0A2W4QT72_9GAMM|nr:MAG: DNA-binding response regulator [Candidatus Methylumidiphilus alinenensis]
MFIEQEKTAPPITVICADNHEIFRQGLLALLKTIEAIETLCQAANGIDAWHHIKQFRPDVAILEIHLPGLSGLDIARNSVQAGLPTQFVLLTAIEAQKAGVAGFVVKSNSFEELMLAVRTVHHGGTFMTASIRAKLQEWHRQGKPNIALSPREREVIRLISLGNGSKEIARILDICPRTVDTYRERSMEKLDLHSVADVVRYAVSAGMVA